MFEKALPTASPDAPALLLDIFIWNAFFPFPPIYDSSGELCIDEVAFTRAVNQLVWNHSPRYSTGMWTRAHHNVMTGNWGPYAGWLVSTRGRDSNDYTRWLFRSLAIPNDTTSGYETTILVPRFFIAPPRREERSPEADLEDEAPEQQVVIVEKENERTIDIQDVLSEHPPVNYTMIADPLREGYKLALPHLPHHQHDLSDLHVPAAKVLSLLPLLNEYDDPPREIEIFWEEQEGGGDDGDKDPVVELIAAIERLGNEEFSWEAFDDMLNEHAELIADTLAQVFLVLKDPQDEIDESAS
ncbi:hypothetical protein F4774DRAFT_401992 [Daldinia eschscholtzii]|nr:hypothetical protein F4774DRAFT_401992 [Daldinia eschscholtzii]